MSEEKESFLESKVLPIAGKIASQRHLVSLRDGIMLAMPLIIIGSVFLIIANFPIAAYQNFMTGVFGKNWATVAQYPVNATFSIMGLVAAFGIAYYLAQSYKVDPLSAGVISIAAFLLAIPLDKLGDVPLALLGSQGLFMAIIFGLGSTEIYRFFVQKNITIKMPPSVPPAVSKSFSALIPGAVIVLIVWLLRILVEQTSVGSLPNVITSVIGKPLSMVGGTYGGSLIAEFAIVFLWSFGIHGANIVGGIMAPVWYGAMDANRIAFQAHHALPNIITQQIFDNFINLGGSGTTIALAFMVAFLAKSKQMRALGKLVVGPAIFNINEPILFGLPIVMNPLMIVPFVLTPIIALTTTYFSMKFGWVALTAGIAVPWTTPPIISGYLATGGHISGAIIQAVNIFISFFIYYPFFRAVDKQKLIEEKEYETEHGTDETESVSL
ncbi:PTS cellobiose transporter subunit IIC [Sporolactobacillus spathodeae]|uniref:Permease IIC component n=1 Tax=Sporolactobacillus spathodeae TaxID=1465502 RepID=A0ABS2QB06_9BACL|nr:PTS cellobiose transporter subunit IIC [Sporolactobacillus spathodeae]MBM7658152.1 PTS system cellobiose-specific IIC component [Sporolactobacillus spathodeae]